MAEAGQSVLIFCPQRRGLTPCAQHIVKLHQQGLKDTILAPGADLADAIAVGAERFGADHILKCLELGVTIHHETLPGPFRKEIERLFVPTDDEIAAAVEATVSELDSQLPVKPDNSG